MGKRKFPKRPCAHCGVDTAAESGVCLPCRRFGGLLASIRNVDLRDGLCAEVDPELFFPEMGGSTREAKRICNGCSVQARCLDYALKTDEWGVWGGTSKRERDRMKRKGNGGAARAS